MNKFIYYFILISVPIILTYSIISFGVIIMLGAITWSEHYDMIKSNFEPNIFYLVSFIMQTAPFLIFVLIGFSILIVVLLPHQKKAQQSIEDVRGLPNGRNEI